MHRPADAVTAVRPKRDDYELLGLGYLNSPAPAFRWPDEAELAAWEAKAAAQPPAQELVDLREKLRAVFDRTDPA
ncbi:hypothetical protein [Streptomyces sp. NPDC056682]|uniref:hypothetical protein n=1 Tax=Streptomyces sp. NPDC056682 TaxID=3345909 RepID=UPI003688550F